jgi:hypothetical protein
MRWEKKGVIFCPNAHYDWMRSHASLPIAERLNSSVLRIYFGTRDASGRSQIGWIDTDANEPRRISGISQVPLLPLGEPGTFDDDGIMPSWLVNHRGRKYLYYIGWNRQVNVPYRLSIGLAVSEDGRSFAKYSKGPVCDRSIDEPFFNTAPCVLLEGPVWRMWYVSCTGWEMVEDRQEPRYHIKYAESSDGLYWKKTGHVCIDYDDAAEAIGRPCVFKDGPLYRMFYSYRRLRNYRTDRTCSYRLGYAESSDGVNWKRNDAETGIAPSASGWDSEMMEYCFLYRHGSELCMLYNGNGFGKTGFGYALLEQSS